MTYELHGIPETGEIGMIEEIWQDGTITSTMIIDNPDQGGWLAVTLGALGEARENFELGYTINYQLVWRTDSARNEYTRRAYATTGQ